MIWGNDTGENHARRVARWRTIARLVLEHRRPGIEVVALAGRGRPARRGARARNSRAVCHRPRPAARRRGPRRSSRRRRTTRCASTSCRCSRPGVSVVVLSAGALARRRLRARSRAAAAQRGAPLRSLRAASAASMRSRPPASPAWTRCRSRSPSRPPAWKGIPYVEKLGRRPRCAASARRTLFEGPAREGVPHFPQNVNIAAVLSLAGIGMDRTRLEVVADPGLTLNTHTIRVSGRRRAHHRGAGERSGAREPEDFLACLLQRACRAQGAGIEGSLRTT